MKLQNLWGFLLVMACMGLYGCATVSTSESTSAHDNMDGTLWMQTSTEYAAVTRGIYAAATVALKEIARSESGGTGGMAIVLDIDETVLDNSRYQAQLVKDNVGFGSESWDRWIALQKASAVPGIVDFIRTSQSLGFHVAFITNRACRARPNTSDECPQKHDTQINLADVGIDPGSTTLFLRGEHPPESCQALLSETEQSNGKWSRDKTSRRECVRLNHDIVMLFGDQLGDFTEVEDRSLDEPGRDLAAQFGEHWGKTWFMLPNPTYGDWQPRTPAGKRVLFRGIE